MFGPPELPSADMWDTDDAGIIPRVCADLFRQAEALEDTDVIFKASFLEVYTEHVIDLLSPERMRVRDVDELLRHLRSGRHALSILQVIIHNNDDDRAKRERKGNGDERARR